MGRGLQEAGRAAEGQTSPRKVGFYLPERVTVSDLLLVDRMGGGPWEEEGGAPCHQRTVPTCLPWFLQVQMTTEQMTSSVRPRERF